MFVQTLEEFRHDRYGPPLASANVLFWYPSRELRIISAWGAVTAADLALVTEAIRDEVHPDFHPFRSLVDMVALERLDPPAFDKFVAFMKDNASTFAKNNIASAYVHAETHGAASAAVSGYTRIIGVSIPTQNYGTVVEGLAGLGFADRADELSDELERMKQAIRAHFMILGPLRRAIDKHRRRPAAAVIARDLKRSTRTLQRDLAGVGTTLTDEVRRVRVELARRLLSTTSMSIAAVAREAGFGATKTFRSAFIKETGMPPASWRSERRRR